LQRFQFIVGWLQYVYNPPSRHKDYGVRVEEMIEENFSPHSAKKEEESNKKREKGEIERERERETLREREG
jgi:hypothetical protein